MSWVTAVNSAPSRMKFIPTPPSTSTRYSAACTTFLVVTTRMAETPIAAAMTPKATFCAVTFAGLQAALAGVRWGPHRFGLHASFEQVPHRGLLPERHWPATSSSLLALGLGARLEGRGLGHGLHPLA